jgi:hypothetical protein
MLNQFNSGNGIIDPVRTDSMAERARITGTRPPAMIQIQSPPGDADLGEIRTSRLQEADTEPLPSEDDHVSDDQLADLLDDRTETPNNDLEHIMNTDHQSDSPGWAAVLRELKRLPWQSWLPLVAAATIMVFVAGVFAGERLAERRTLLEMHAQVVQMEEERHEEQQQMQQQMRELDTKVVSLSKSVADRDMRLTAAEKQTKTLTEALRVKQRLEDALSGRVWNLERQIKMIKDESDSHDDISGADVASMEPTTAEIEPDQ